MNPPVPCKSADDCDPLLPIAEAGDPMPLDDFALDVTEVGIGCPALRWTTDERGARMAVAFSALGFAIREQGTHYLMRLPTVVCSSFMISLSPCAGANPIANWGCWNGRRWRMIELPTTPVLDNALLADIGDGEFRTYAFICHLAWRTHPQAEQPYTDLDYEQLAHFHPGNVPLTVSGIRARINRLVKAGLLRRERTNNICWRTYPTLDTPAQNETVGVMPDHTQPLRVDNCASHPTRRNRSGCDGA